MQKQYDQSVPIYSRSYSTYCLSISRHLGSYKTDKFRGTQHKGGNTAVQSSQLSWAGQCKKCVQYDFKLTSVMN